MRAHPCLQATPASAPPCLPSHHARTPSYTPAPGAAVHPRRPLRVVCVAALTAFWRDVVEVASQRVWMLTCLGYTLYVAVMGVYSYWWVGGLLLTLDTQPQSHSG